jgi:hypothetical protein
MRFVQCQLSPGAQKIIAQLTAVDENNEADRQDQFAELVPIPRRPSPPPHVQPTRPEISITEWQATSTQAAVPTQKVCVGDGYKLIAGGAKVNWSGAGSLLTASFPEGNCWTAASKQHQIPGPATITVWAIAIKDTQDEWDVRTVESTGNRGAQPYAQASLPPGYTMTGGGGRTNWSGAGSLLTASYPENNFWSIRDHHVSDPVQAAAYVIGIRPKNGSAAPEGKVFFKHWIIGLPSQCTIAGR